MTALQRIQLRQSEVRSLIAAELDKAAEDRADGALETLTAQAKGLEVEYRAALTLQEERAVPDRVETPEGRELAELYRRSSMLDYMDEILETRPVDGASREFREAILGDNRPGFMPLDFLLEPDEERIEQRADAVTNIATAIQENQQSIAQRVFARSASAYLGIMMPSVAVGTVSYPRLSAGTVADVRSDGVELDGTVATITTESVNPVRLTASYTFGVETLARVQGFEESLRRDLRSVLSDKLDALTLRGQAASGSDSPAVTGIIGSLTNPTDPTAVADWQAYLTAFDGGVDGKYAVSEMEVRLLVNVATWKHAKGLTAGTDGRAGLLRDILPRDRFRSSANMPVTASNIGSGIRYAFGAGNLARGFYAPIWRGVQFIIDPYTKAKSGQRIVTGVMMTGFSMVDGSAYSRVEFKTA